MDKLISANKEVLKVIKSFSINEVGEMNKSDFQMLMLDIINKKERADADDEI